MLSVIFTYGVFLIKTRVSEQFWFCDLEAAKFAAGSSVLSWRPLLDWSCSVPQAVIQCLAASVMLGPQLDCGDWCNVTRKALFIFSAAIFPRLRRHYKLRWLR